MTTFSVAYDYRCPFARNAHEHVLDGLEAGAGWDVHFLPFSLTQLKQPSWDKEQDRNLYGLELSVAVRDTQPEVFLGFHRAMFELRHDLDGDLRDAEAVNAAAARAGVDLDAVTAELATGVPFKTLRQEHDGAIASHDVWGVPTFIAGDQAVFVRVMDRPARSDRPATEVIDRIIDLLVGWPALNEFKHTSIPR